MKKIIKSADGAKGVLIYSGNTFYFRVYEANGTFVDYDILHSDLSVTIDDSDAYFYKYDNDKDVLDHSPETLGITIVTADPNTLETK